MDLRKFDLEEEKIDQRDRQADRRHEELSLDEVVAIVNLDVEDTVAHIAIDMLVLALVP